MVAAKNLMACGCRGVGVRRTKGDLAARSSGVVVVVVEETPRRTVAVNVLARSKLPLLLRLNADDARDIHRVYVGMTEAATAEARTEQMICTRSHQLSCSM